MKKFIPLVFFILAGTLFGLDEQTDEDDLSDLEEQVVEDAELDSTQSFEDSRLQITGRLVGADLRLEYNRSLLYSLDFLQAFAEVELNDLYAFKGGLALGDTSGGFDIKLFTKGEIGPLFGVPLYFSLAWIYNGLPAYKAHSHTLLPVVSFNGKWAGVSIGPGFLFTRFFGEKSAYESMLSFSIYGNFINNEKLRLGISWTNSSDFSVGTTGSYFLRIYSYLHLTDKLALVNDIELLQSGSIGLAANFYGIAYRGGVRFTW